MIACKVLRFASIKLEVNFLDILTKPLPRAIFKRLVKPLLLTDPPGQILPEGHD